MATIPPARGPRILLFSGGSAPAALSRALTRFTYNSIHLITPFDSGGSSGRLRESFSMLSVGDLRNRLTALLDPDAAATPAIARFLGERFAVQAVPAALRDRLQSIVTGRGPLVRELPQALRDLVRADLDVLHRALPEDFDLRGACVGNLALTGGYLRSGRSILRALGNLTSAAQVRGVVRPTARGTAHLAARLADGPLLVGQHEIARAAATGAPRIVDVFLVESLDVGARAHVEALPVARDLIGQADLICYAMGSFWTSLAAALLPEGLGHAIARSPAPKVYLPSIGRDPETRAPLPAAVASLLEIVRRDAGSGTPISRLLDAVILDRDHRRYAVPLEIGQIQARGVEVIERDLGDPARLAALLCQLAAKP